jgi:N-acetylglucosamine-6-phosphate deacetylase
MLTLTVARLLTPVETLAPAFVTVETGRIVDFGPRAATSVPVTAPVHDLGDVTLAPGLVDIHLHGGAGHDVMESGSDALLAIEKSLARQGVTAYLPTTVTASLDDTLRALERLAAAIEQAQRGDARENRARPLGVHLEGPFLSHARRGVHPPEHLQWPTLAVFDRLWQAARGHVRLMTIAPELDGALEVIAEAVRRGVRVSLGHSDADLTSARAGIAAGARHATHTFNAMRPLGHRDPGLLGVLLTDPRLTADIIADGVHLDPAIVKLFLQAKGAENAVLISDATAATGMPDGKYRLGSFDVEVRDGRCMADGRLAGSVLTLDRAVRNVMEFAGWGLQNAVRAASANPARVLGLDAEVGQVRTGARADFVVLSSDGRVQQTILGGVVERVKTA